jgi:hypothetical protein
VPRGWSENGFEWFGKHPLPLSYLTRLLSRESSTGYEVKSKLAIKLVIILWRYALKRTRKEKKHCFGLAIGHQLRWKKLT